MNHKNAELLGYHINCDDALCVDCFDEVYFVEHPDNPAEQAAEQILSWRAAGGFEGWQEPIAIFGDSEADTPTFCARCNRLIPHALTSHGLTEARELMLEHPESGQAKELSQVYG